MESENSLGLGQTQIAAVCADARELSSSALANLQYSQDDPASWVIIDTETDGLEYPIHVLEVAAQRMRGRMKDGEPFRVFLNHQIPIPAMATAIHGYTQEFLSRHGVPPVAAHEQLRRYVEDRHVAAHYLRYDWNAVLLPEWRRLKIAQIGRPGLCTWHLAKRAIPEFRSHCLDALRERFGLPTKEAHSAIGDVDSVWRLLSQVIFPRLDKAGLGEMSDLVRFSRETPLLKCHCLIEGKDYADEVRKRQKERRDRKAREKLIHEIQAGLIPDVAHLLCDRGFITRDPEIEFKNRTFLFTGKMIWGTRPAITPFVELLGGNVSKSKTVTAKIDFLVLGEDEEKGWTALLRGGKIVDAVCGKIADEHSRLSIVLESDFIDSLWANLVAKGHCVNPDCS